MLGSIELMEKVELHNRVVQFSRKLLHNEILPYDCRNLYRTILRVCDYLDVGDIDRIQSNIYRTFKERAMLDGLMLHDLRHQALFDCFIWFAYRYMNAVIGIKMNFGPLWLKEDSRDILITNLIILWRSYAMSNRILFQLDAFLWRYFSDSLTLTDDLIRYMMILKYFGGYGGLSSLEQIRMAENTRYPLSTPFIQLDVVIECSVLNYGPLYKKHFEDIYLQHSFLLFSQYGKFISFSNIDFMYSLMLYAFNMLGKYFMPLATIRQLWNAMVEFGIKNNLHRFRYQDFVNAINNRHYESIKLAFVLIKLVQPQNGIFLKFFHQYLDDLLSIRVGTNIGADASDMEIKRRIGEVMDIHYEMTTLVHKYLDGSINFTKIIHESCGRALPETAPRILADYWDSHHEHCINNYPVIDIRNKCKRLYHILMNKKSFHDIYLTRLTQRLLKNPENAESELTLIGAMIDDEDRYGIPQPWYHLIDDVKHSMQLNCTTHKYSAIILSHDLSKIPHLETEHVALPSLPDSCPQSLRQYVDSIKKKFTHNENQRLKLLYNECRIALIINKFQITVSFNQMCILMLFVGLDKLNDSLTIEEIERKLGFMNNTLVGKYIKMLVDCGLLKLINHETNSLLPESAVQLNSDINSDLHVANLDILVENPLPTEPSNSFNIDMTQQRIKCIIVRHMKLVKNSSHGAVIAEVRTQLHNCDVVLIKTCIEDCIVRCFIERDGDRYIYIP